MRFAASFRLTTALLLAVAAAGCVGGNGSPQRMAAVAIAPSGVDGSWVDETGVGVSTFSNGTFSTTALDNGSKLSEGTYRFNGSNTVAITGTSLIRQQPIAFNCNIASRSQLNCTSAEGNRFILTRRA
ncbi:hypothetical protein [Tianweitania sediminis]|jgi:hypothetical protein|uniref:Outer membrane lipoprotein n=1 Tax=Tianweitania sediminis TaxID=1502156 RepID=A0A8J7UIU3_9HYPH|nr:hypothetical protein [Tianweitania sediminis]MBP0439293.1 hypothetical protein [Tianweitania sediminis]HEV7416179.1 hypothetical protein [Tianweitania sediminis]